MATLTATDASSISFAIHAKVMKKVEGGRLNLKNGKVVCLCSDGDQSSHTIGVTAEEVASQAGRARVHIIAGNGGALNIAPHSPTRHMGRFLPMFVGNGLDDRLPKVAKFAILKLAALVGCLIRTDLVTLISIWGGCKLKKIETVGLYIHAPCGAAGVCGMSFYDTLRHLCEAKRRLKRFLALGGMANVKVPCLIQVDWGDGKKELFFVKTTEALAWLDGKSIPISDKEIEVVESERGTFTSAPTAPANLSKFTTVRPPRRTN